ncbi:MAG: Rossmann-like and DUF2520 domain-containing protein [Bacillota bacterium]|nr:Rossmann-like and DUF2520 domain-containing protein [Bacillota bacterium]
MKIGFIGAGKVGTSFGKFLITKGFNVIGYSSRGSINLEKAIKFTNTKRFNSKELINKSDLIFITVNDDNIKNVVDDSIKKFSNLKGKTFIHMSGAHSSKLLINAYELGAKVYSLHPLQSVSNIENAVKDFDDSVFSIETIDDEINESIQEILDVLKSYFKIDSDKKAIYHMSACVFSNYLNTLMDFGLELTSSLGISKEFAFDAMRPLINSSLENIRVNGIEKSLTGPLSRGDVNTIKTHLNTYDENNQKFKNFYEFMGLKTLNYIKKNQILDEIKINELRNTLEGNYEKNNNSKFFKNENE